MLKKRLMAIEHQERLNSRDSGIDKEHFEAVHFPMNKLPQENGEYLSYMRDYDQDLQEYNGGREDQIEQWYSTIKRKPKDQKKKNSP